MIKKARYTGNKEVNNFYMLWCGFEGKIQCMGLKVVKSCSFGAVRIHLFSHRVRMILSLGYWVLGNICRYWVIFFCDTQYYTDQTAVGTVHVITI